MPLFFSWNETKPVLTGAAGSLFSPTVVQSSWKADPLEVLSTVTFSFVGVVLYAVSVQEYSQVASAAWGSQLGAAGVPSAVADGAIARTRQTRNSRPPARTRSG